MKISSWIVALNFGEGATAQLHVLAVTAPSAELAVAHSVSTVVQALKIEQPLTRVIWDELREGFLVAALAQMRGESGEEKVVSLRVVEPDSAAAEQPVEPSRDSHPPQPQPRPPQLAQAEHLWLQVREHNWCDPNPPSMKRLCLICYRVRDVSTPDDHSCPGKLSR